MIKTELPTLSNGDYSTYSMVGGYSLFYMSENDRVVCAQCLNTEESFHSADEPEYNVVRCDVHWEGDPLECDECSGGIEPSYE
jgi:hypothetical protein